jgi:hypothetical protein
MQRAHLLVAPPPAARPRSPWETFSDFSKPWNDSVVNKYRKVVLKNAIGL